MSKPYFAKYLPIEGKVLCSRDIRIGDIVIDTDEYNSPLTVVEGNAKTQRDLPDNQVVVVVGKALGCYKVLGKISLDAAWVKDGDEFDESEIGIGDKVSTYKPYLYLIKCPTCGTFH